MIPAPDIYSKVRSVRIIAAVHIINHMYLITLLTISLGEKGMCVVVEQVTAYQVVKRTIADFG